MAPDERVFLDHLEKGAFRQGIVEQNGVLKR